MDLQTRVTLNDGARMPIFGLGTWMSTGRDAFQAVAWALEAGYRLIDTAKSYGNEAEIGEAIRASAVAREEIFVTTKLWPTDQGRDRTLKAFEASRRRLGVDVDLYLVHWPGDDPRRRHETWRTFEALKAEGRVRSIGVSNYSTTELREMIAAGGTVPSVNQILFSPFAPQKDIVSFCRSRGIRVEGYSSLTRGRNFRNERILAIARELKRTPAQVLLRWALQKDVTVIPKSVHKERIEENARVFDFELTKKDMARLDALGRED